MGIRLGKIFLAMTLAHAAPGHRLTQDAHLPEAVRQAARAVFRIVVPSLGAERLSTQQYDAFERGLQGRDPDDFATRFDQLRLNRCRTQKRPTCWVGEVLKGSAFVLAESHELVTARHVFFDRDQGRDLFLGNLQQRGRLNQLSPGKRWPQLQSLAMNFYLLNEKEEVIFDSVEGADQARLSFVGDPWAMRPGAVFDQRGFFLGAFANTLDVLTLKLKHRLPVLALASSSREGEAVFVPGYPDRTFNRAQTSDGRGPWVSQGSVLPGERALSGQGVSQSVAALFSARTLSIDVDGVPGMSGAPVVDAQGKVLGIFVAQWRGLRGRGPASDVWHAYNPQGGYALRMDWVNDLGRRYPFPEKPAAVSSAR